MSTKPYFSTCSLFLLFFFLSLLPLHRKGHVLPTVTRCATSSWGKTSAPRRTRWAANPGTPMWVADRTPPPSQDVGPSEPQSESPPKNDVLSPSHAEGTLFNAKPGRRRAGSGHGTGFWPKTHCDPCTQQYPTQWHNRTQTGSWLHAPTAVLQRVRTQTHYTSSIGVRAQRHISKACSSCFHLHAKGGEQHNADTQMNKEMTYFNDKWQRGAPKYCGK